MGFLTILLYFFPIVIFLYFKISKRYSYWTDQNVPGPRPIFPFGYLWGRFTRRAIEFEVEHGKKYGRCYGVFNSLTPTLTIADAELIKTVLVKDFHLFVNRRKFNILDPYWNKNLFFSHGEDWKRIRSITTPAFTSGKLRRMFPLLKQAVDRLENHLEEVSKRSDRSFEAKSVISNFTIQVISSTSFGTDISVDDHSKVNSFLHYGTDFFTNNSSLIRFMAILTLPESILKWLRIPHPWKYEASDFFVNVCKSMVERTGRRDDLITLLKEASVSDEEIKNMNFDKLMASSEAEVPEVKNEDKSSTKKNAKFLSDVEVVAQCIIFFLAGFETSASTIQNCLFHLARDQQVQERLYEEVTEKLADVDRDNLDEYYDAIMKMPFLEAVIKETLRLYPPVTRLERRVGADSYQLGGIQLKRDHLIEISTIALMRDPDYYENPNVYNPERFMPENKHKLTPYTYLPFGDGPRNCVGKRFAYQELFICLASLIQKFRFETNCKTPAEIQFPKKNGTLIPMAFEISVSRRE